ncbi:DUF362 domain-containing protein [Candidatus Poribacteria bacterium]
MKNQRKIDRREFIKDVSIAGLGLAAGPALLGMSARKSSAQVGMSKIVIANHPDAVTGVRVDAGGAREMVDTGIMQFTGQPTITGAWASVLPNLSPDDLVTIKVNCINSSLPTHPQVVDAIVAGLIAAGVKENNIIIWDRTNHELTNCGYKRNTGNTGVRCFGTNENGWGYDKQIKPGGRSVRLSKILLSSDHLINVPVLKDHGTSGVTLSMKNHYGSVDNPGSLHGGQCDPYIAELNNAPEIKDKTRIIVLDANLGIYQGGPGGSPQFRYNSVVLSQDTVAIDYQGWKILEAERQKHGRALPQAKHIKTAANMGLGSNNPDEIELEVIDVKTKAVRASGKMRTTWGAIKI